MDESRARELLSAERTEVAALLRETEEATDADHGVNVGPGDYGDAALPLTEQAEDEAVAEDLRERLDAIDRALARLEAGTYGRDSARSIAASRSRRSSATASSSACSVSGSAASA